MLNISGDVYSIEALLYQFCGEKIEIVSLVKKITICTNHFDCPKIYKKIKIQSEKKNITLKTLSKKERSPHFTSNSTYCA